LGLTNKNVRSLKRKGNLITYFNSNSIINDQFSAIRTNIKFMQGKQKKQIILITSPEKGDGKTTITANLAVSMAKQGEKVLLIDANLREPAIHNVFKIPNQIGLKDLLTNKATFNDVIYKTHIGQLDIITSGHMLLNPAELIESKTMVSLLHTVVNTYQMILIDSPPILKSTETRVLANECDGVVLVMSRRKTKRGKLAESRKLLELADAKILGAIINEK